jgi:hypothetical protein
LLGALCRANSEVIAKHGHAEPRQPQLEHLCKGRGILERRYSGWAF